MPAPQRPTLLVRPCFQQDLEQVQLIYADHVLTGTGTFEVAPPSLEEMTARWTRIVEAGWPYLVCSPTRDLTRVLGFAYAQQFNPREGYKQTFEDSIYVSRTSERQGVGKALLSNLVDQLRIDGARELIAVIGDRANQASIGLHAAQGFTEVGCLRRVGQKFGRWLDVVYMQRSFVES
ncbi:MAG: N-acetyltransferase family protein [Hyphomonadaceae bacterium]